MSLPNLKKHGAPGFTLVEMAIVLVIIGIILAGVMKGRDIVRGAQVKQFSQQFAQKWATIAQTYYDKTGRVLNDGATNGGDGVLDGKMDANLGATMADDDGMVAILNRVGIVPCSLIKSKLTTDLAATLITGQAAAAISCDDTLNLTATQVEGEFTGPVNVAVDLDNMTIYRTATPENRNIVVLYNVPTDVAIGLDTAIDGTESGENGSFVNLADTARNTATAEANTLSSDDTANTYVWPAATDAGTQQCAIILDF